MHSAGRHFPNAKVRWSFISLVVIAGNVTVIAGCGGGGSSKQAAPPTITSVTVSCIPSAIRIDQTNTCTPAVAGTGNFSKSVTWSVTPTSMGKVSSSGVYTPAAVGNAAITATSAQDSSKSGNAP